MILKIGAIYQDANSRGFLVGLKKRLGCGAEIIQQPTPVGKSAKLNRKQAKVACAHFRTRDVDLILRFTDSDIHRWQDVRRNELKWLCLYAHVPVVCGVAVRNTEVLLLEMRDYLSDILDVSATEIDGEDDPTGLVKGAIARAKRNDEETHQVVARIVASAPAETFKQCFRNPAFQLFYSDCRAEATRQQCQTPNEQ